MSDPYDLQREDRKQLEVIQAARAWAIKESMKFPFPSGEPRHRLYVVQCALYHCRTIDQYDEGLRYIVEHLLLIIRQRFRKKQEVYPEEKRYSIQVIQLNLQSIRFYDTALQARIEDLLECACSDYLRHTMPLPK